MKTAQTIMVTWLMILPLSQCFHYMPGIKPHSFKVDEEVIMKVNAMTSIHTQIPKGYYELPFCKPSDGAKMASENLGEFLTGNKIMSSPYQINMLRDNFCTVLCQSKIDTKQAKNMRAHIRYGYHNNWIIDNLPSASLGLTESGMKQHHYAGGFPIGFYDRNSHEAYVYNHANIFLEYHLPENAVDEYRVVGFSVQPISVDHKYADNYNWDGKASEGYTKHLQSCPPSGSHMSIEYAQKPQIVQPDTDVIFTYDVQWVRSDVVWASRWDVYLTEDHMVPAQVHWYSITNSILVVVFLSLLVVNVLVRNLRRDIAGYNAVPLTDEEREEELDESGWKLIHADVFRPPSTMPMIFCVFVGSGVQISIATFACIIFSAIGFLSPARRGSLMTMTLVFYILCGAFAGYASSRLYKTFRGRNWQLCTLATATMFPGITFGFFIFFNIVLSFVHSSASVPFLDVLIVATMWCCISIPLVFLGAYFGYKKDVYSYPTKISTIARVVPETTILLNPKVGMVFAGMVPFAATYVELFFIMTSLWMDQYYYVFGFTLIVYLLLLITCAEGSILLCYYQFCVENHRWWWYSFFTSGSTAFYMMVYSVVWFRQLESSKLVITHMLYFGYMFIISFGMFLTTGMIGFFSCFIFTRKIFGAIKVD